LATPTGEVAIRKLTTEAGQGRGLMMPRRKKTRQQERHDRVTAERRINKARIADEQRRHHAWLVATYEPPPF
jgi:hypothetical protein